jgi:uncharacterized membrane protein YbhN (UPF0104 family)
VTDVPPLGTASPDLSEISTPLVYLRVRRMLLAAGSSRVRHAASVVALLAVSGLVATLIVNPQAATRVWNDLSQVRLDLLRLRWEWACVVVALAAFHYGAAAVAARAASGRRLPLGETLLVQLAASTADRLTPAGLGGAAVNARYFTRKGMSRPGAIAAVTSLSALGPVTDVAVIAFLVFGGPWVGVHGGGHEVAALSRKALGLVSLGRSWLVWLGAAIVVTVGGFFALRHRPKGGRQFCGSVRGLAREPGRLGILVAGSAATSLGLSFAFAASVAMVPGPRPTEALGSLLITYMLGTAAGNAVPLPSGGGSTEVALVAALVAAHVPVTMALEQVFLFRLITFWAPAAGGLAAAGWLRTRHVL